MQLVSHLATLKKTNLHGLTERELLERGSAHIFSTGTGDGSSLLARENMTYGLAKIQWVQAELGLEPSATFTSTPDEGITRNIKRWEDGVAYGGKISWGDGKEKLVILDTKPNACGMLVGALDEVPKPEDIAKKLYEFEKTPCSIKGLPVVWDFAVGNHFLDVFEVKPHGRKKLPPYIVIVHAGCPELKGDNSSKWGFGLYWHKSKILSQMAKEIETPFGRCRIFTDNNAKNYFNFFKFAEVFAQKRREIIYKEIFEGKEIICNQAHQALINMNEHILGCQFMHSERQIFPISIRADLPSWLVHGKKNFTPEQIEALGFNKRARELGIYKRLRRTNLLPHGGGYMFPDTLKVERVFEINNKRFFELDMIDGIGKKIVSNMSALSFAYRSTEVLARVEEIGLARLVAELMPVFTIKI